MSGASPADTASNPPGAVPSRGRRRGPTAGEADAHRTTMAAARMPRPMGAVLLFILETWEENILSVKVKIDDRIG